MLLENHQQRSDDLWSIFAKNTEKKYFLEEKRHVNFPAAKQVASLSLLMKATWGEKRERAKKLASIIFLFLLATKFGF